MIQRHVEAAVRAALLDTPAVLLTGPRQAGKTTLAKELRPRPYVTLDLALPRAAAAADPDGFVAGLPAEVALDEVQRVPELFLALKAAIDSDRRPGRFLLTGSANVLLVPRVADALPGRIEIITLWPFSQGELEGRRDRFVDAVFADILPVPESGDLGLDADALFDRLVRGGFPEATGRASGRRSAWYESYMTSLVEREVRDLAGITGTAELLAMTRLVAARNAGLLNLASIARDAGLAHSTARRYLRLLEAVFLVVVIPAWSTNLSSRVAKAPKVILSDSGVAAHLLDLDIRRLAARPEAKGGLLEGFVAMEVLKQLSWNETRVRLWHLRTRSGEAVDLVLEGPGGMVVGVEVKAGTTVRAGDFRGLHALRTLAGNRFRRGVVLHTGREAAAFGPDLWALPVSALWRLQPPP